jgi:dTDP-4-amino-4,6-dideoxygalactose transaminase
MQRIYLCKPHMSGNEQSYVQQAFDSNWIAPLGPNVDGFESELNQCSGGGHAVALVSGTAAIHLALVSLGISPAKDQEIICSTFTFSATANPIIYAGATPVFVDSEPESWNMDPTLLEQCIVERTALGKNIGAVIVVHLYGMPARMHEIWEVCRRYRIPIIEDAAEALGATYAGRALGIDSEFGILSFNGNKIITTSGGGALICRSQEVAEQIRFLSTQARDPAPHYQHSQLGFNYRMSNVLAGIGRGQLTALNDRVKEKRAIFARYQRLLSPIAGLHLGPQEAPGSYSNRWLSTMIVDPKLTGGVDRETVRLKLDSLGIETRPLWKPLHCQPYFQAFACYGGAVSEELFEKGLCLPSSTNMTGEEWERVSTGLLGCFPATSG